MFELANFDIRAYADLVERMREKQQQFFRERLPPSRERALREAKALEAEVDAATREIKARAGSPAAEKRLLPGR